MQPRPVRRPSTVKYHQPYAPHKEEKEYEEFTVDRSEGYNDHYFEVEDNGRENWEMEGEEEPSEGFEEGRHDAVTERRKRNKFEIFVGGLDRDACEEDLRKVFSQVGEITEVRLMKNPITKKNKGFAFIRFATAEQSRRAVNELKHPVVNGKQCGVAPSQDSDTLFVGNICREWTKEILKEELVHYGVENFEELTLVEDAKNEGMNRGFAFLDFSSRADALEACKRLQKRDVVFGTDRTARVAFADTFIEPDDEIMSQVRTVFIDGLPSTWDEDRIKEHLKKFGRIEKVELARNMPAAKRNDFGFITFYTHDAAMACIDSINDSEIVSGHKKVKVRARLSRPRQRGKSSKHARGGYPIGQGGDRGVNASWGSSMSHMDTRRFTGHNERSIPSRRVFDDSLKRSLDHRDRHSSGDLVANRTESRRQYPAPDRSFKRRSTASSYEHMRQDESFTRQVPDFSRASIERQSYRDAYLSHRSEYLEDSPISASRVAARRVSPLYDDDDSYGYMENSSRYSDSHIRDYSSISGLKRPYSAIEESYPRYAALSSKQSRARSDYGSSSGLPYTDLYYKTDSRRLVHGSSSDYDGGSRSSAGHSRGLYDRSTSKKISREDTEEMYPKYSRDDESRGYVSSRSNLDSDSFPPIYSNRRMNDGYLGGKDSESYY